MSFKIRPSKYRHVFGTGSRKDSCYEGIKLTRTSDSNLCAVNPKFVSVVTESAGGGSFIVLPLAKTGRVDANHPRVAGHKGPGPVIDIKWHPFDDHVIGSSCHETGRVDANHPRVAGHKGPVIDIKWHPFDDHVIASSSEDKTVKVWKIPEQGLKYNLTDWSVDLHGHHKKVDQIEWHPTAENILLSSAQDFKCIVWNTQQAEPVTAVQCHTQPIHSTSWNRDGSLFATTCRDKMIRVIDPRSTQVAMEALGHTGSRNSKVIYLADSTKLFTCGFSTMSERLYSVWDVRNMSDSIKTDTIDRSNGILMPFYDHDSNVMFLAGKGDGNIRYYEFVNDSTCCHYLSQFPSSFPQKGMGAMPKRGCDPWKCEIMRFYKVHADKSLCEPISMVVPRRADTFQDDLFPLTNSIHPSSTADQWISGINRDPILISLKDGTLSGKPKTTTSKAVQQSDAGLNQSTITTYKAVDKHLHSNERCTRQKSFPGTKEMSPEIITEPASIKNIRQLSLMSESNASGDFAFRKHTSPVTSPTTHYNSHTNHHDNGHQGNSSHDNHIHDNPEKLPRRSVSRQNGYNNNCENLDAEPQKSPQPTSPPPLSPRTDIEIIELYQAKTETVHETKRENRLQNGETVEQLVERKMEQNRVEYRKYDDRKNVNNRQKRYSEPFLAYNRDNTTIPLSISNFEMSNSYTTDSIDDNSHRDDDSRNTNINDVSMNHSNDVSHQCANKQVDNNTTNTTINANTNTDLDAEYSADKFREISDVWNRKVERFWNAGRKTDTKTPPRRAFSLRLPPRTDNLVRKSILDDSIFDKQHTNSENNTDNIENDKNNINGFNAIQENCQNDQNINDKIITPTSTTPTTPTKTTPSKITTPTDDNIDDILNDNNININGEQLSLYNDTSPVVEEAVLRKRRSLGRSRSFVHSTSMDSENLKKAYFNQVEEINSLKEQLSLKDKRIRQLEEELSLVRGLKS